MLFMKKTSIRLLDLPFFLNEWSPKDICSFQQKIQREKYTFVYCFRYALIKADRDQSESEEEIDEERVKPKISPST
jgi:hypothetical protein